MFTAYLCLGGHYASEGDLINEFLRYYNEYKSGIPKLLCMVSACGSLLMKPGKEKTIFVSVFWLQKK